MARELGRITFRLTSPLRFRRDFTLRNQIWSSSGSVMDNIAEGFDDGSPRECRRFLGYSQRSCSEVQSQLCRALDGRYITQSEFDEGYGKASECRRQIRGLRKYLHDFARSGRMAVE
jgi:four helix bundle protein